MTRYFNTTGPCRARKNYMLPPEGRLPDLLPLVDQELYVVVHATRSKPCALPPLNKPWAT